MNSPSLPRYVNDREAAQVLGLAPGTLRNWRWKKEGPVYVILGGGVVRYPLSELIEFANARRVAPKAVGE